MTIFQRVFAPVRKAVHLMKNIQARLVNIERKLDELSTRVSVREDLPHGLPHPDQWYGCLTYSQHGEDLLLMDIFHKLGIEKPSYLDIGAHHPIHISNTALLYARGSRGINVEANPNLIGKFHSLRQEDINLNVGVSDKPGTIKFYMIDKLSGRNTFDEQAARTFVRNNPRFDITEVIEIEVTTVDAIVGKYANGRFPDFLSIDVEGYDAKVLASIDFTKTYPKVICVETVGAAGEDTSELITAVLIAAGYSPYCSMGGNTIYAHNAYRELLRR